MKQDFSQLAPKVAALLGPASGLPLKLAHLSKQGIEFVFENKERRAEVLILPRVYTEGKVIVDAINDLVIGVELRIYEFEPTSPGVPSVPTSTARLELPFSTWFDEGDYH